MISPLEDLDDDHVSPAAWAWWSGFVRFGRRIVGSRWRDREQLAGAFEVVLAGIAGEQTVVTDAVEPATTAVPPDTSKPRTRRPRPKEKTSKQPN